MDRELVIRRGGKVVQAGADAAGPAIARLKAAAESSLYVFCKTVMECRDFTTDFHGEACRFLQSIPPHVPTYLNRFGEAIPSARRKAWLAPRSTFKSYTAMGLAVHLTIQPAESNIYMPGRLGANTRILYAAEVADLAEKRINYIKTAYESNRLLRALWPHIVWEEGRRDKTKPKWNQTRLLLPRTENYPECTIERTGIDAAITGGHFDVLLKDDLISINARNSEAVMRTAIAWNNTSRALAVRRHELIEFYFGTRWGAWDLYSDLQETDPSVGFLVRSIIEDGEYTLPESIINKAEMEELRVKDEDLYFLNYMNTVVGSHLTDFDMKRVRRFDLQDGKLVFEGNPQDEVLEKIYRGSHRMTTVGGVGGGEKDLLEPGENLKGQPLNAENYRLLRGGAKGMGFILRAR